MNKEIEDYFDSEIKNNTKKFLDVAYKMSENFNEDLREYYLICLLKTIQISIISLFVQIEAQSDINLYKLVNNFKKALDDELIILENVRKERSVLH